MCGIAGIIHSDGRPVDCQVLKRMTDTLVHRGPDDEGYYINRDDLGGMGAKWQYGPGNGNVGLGHRRLSIIDLASGHQPMANADETIWIVFNGEIYNFPALRKELSQKGYRFQTRCDTETIIYAYEEWGDDCVSHLRGMFAFALWDQRRRRLFIGRDRLGIKPLYYFWDGSTFLFGSELKAILAFPGISRDINPQAMADYFALLYIPAPKSIFTNIVKLPAGHSLTLEEGTLQQKQYWDLRFQPNQSLTESQWCECLVEKLREAIELRLVSEVPLGAFLSGGIDSSAVVALMAGMMTSPVKTSSIGFDDSRFNELPYAREMVERYRTDHNERIVRPDALEALDRLTWHYDEPFADSSALPTYYVSQMTRQSVTVALSGDGGDENFGGYRRYFYDVLENRLRGYLPRQFRQHVLGSLAAIYPKADWLPQIFRAKTLLTNLSLDPLAGYYNSMSWFGKDKTGIFSPAFARTIGEYSPSALFEQYGRESGTSDPLSRIQYVDIKTYLVDDILTKVDRASMAHSLEVRVPLLDHEFMELAATIPSGLKLKGREGKHVFKQALRPYVSSNILDRPKQGFSIPLKNWLRQDLKPVFESTVFLNDNAVMEYLDRQRVSELWEAHQSGMRDYATELWAILFFAQWHKKYM